MENVQALANLIKSQVDSYCSRQSLDLKQNVDACCDDQSDGSEGSESGEILTNLQKPPAPVRKRDWKSLTKEMRDHLE